MSKEQHQEVLHSSKLRDKQSNLFCCNLNAKEKSYSDIMEWTIEYVRMLASQSDVTRKKHVTFSFLERD
jgi:hypothetical protein